MPNNTARCILWQMKYLIFFLLAIKCWAFDPLAHTAKIDSLINQGLMAQHIPSNNIAKDEEFAKRLYLNAPQAACLLMMKSFNIPRRRKFL